MIVVLDEPGTTTPSVDGLPEGYPCDADTQLGIAVRRIFAEANPVDPQAAVARFNSAI
jgi:hypothetical protein